MYIPYSRQLIGEDDIAAVAEVLRSDYLTTGPKIEEFEHAVGSYVNAGYAVAVSNGTAALHAACAAAGIGPGDEVITTPLTFAASSNCVLYCGGTPVFADIDPLTYNLDPLEVRRKITDKTKAIIAVHYAGQPCDMDALRAIADEYGLWLIEDGAHALGADYKGKKVGGISDMTTFSFHPVKQMTTGEGGMITTGREDLYKKLLLFRGHGITRDTAQMTRTEGGWFYQQLDLGYNYRLSDIQCALGISQLKKLDAFVEIRRRQAIKYGKAFAGTEQIVCPGQQEGCNSSWHLYVVRIKGKGRREVFDFLREAGIGVNVHYIPVYLHPYYQEHGYRDISCPEAEALYRDMLSIPLHPSLTEEEQDYVTCQIRKALK